MGDHLLGWNRKARLAFTYGRNDPGISWVTSERLEALLKDTTAYSQRLLRTSRNDSMVGYNSFASVLRDSTTFAMRYLHVVSHISMVRRDLSASILGGSTTFARDIAGCQPCLSGQISSVSVHIER